MLSQKIIQFISNLPHFQFDEIDGNYVATRLTDGTVFMPSHEAGDNERGLIYACWQGDCAHKTMVIGTQIASLEIVEAVKYWVATGEMENEQESVKSLFQHFQYKTGERLNISEDSFMTKQMQELLKYLGLEAIKKMIGL
jgi:hypothetical protein